MSEELYTVEYASERLKLHPKTVLRFIREGRLRATKVGKAYRILRSDVEAFAGVPAGAEETPGEAWVTSIVDVPNVGPALAQKWARQVPSALHSNRKHGPPMRADVIYEPARSHLKIIIVGAPNETANLLGLIKVWLEQLKV